MNNNDKSSNTIFWIIAAVLFVSGAWPIAVPLVLIKLFGQDKRASQRRQAPPLNMNITAANRTRTSASSYYNNAYSQQAASNTQAQSGYTQAQNYTQTSRYNQTSNYTQAKNYTQTAASAQAAARSIMTSPGFSKLKMVALCVGGAFLALIGLGLMSADMGIWYAMSAIGFILGGGSMIAGGVLMDRASKRYKKYLAAIGDSQAVEIKSLAKKMGLNEKRVNKDLEKMIDLGYFGNSAYVNNELGFLLLSSTADEELNKYRAEAMKKAQEAKEQQASGVLAEGYQKIIDQIRDVNDRIAHPVMSEKIYHIEDITRQIFTAVQHDPSKRGMIDNFLSYYLPTTLKLLESYAQLEKAGVDGGNIASSKQSIENAMDSIVTGFENQFDQLYKADALDIETDIDVMTKMLKNDMHTAKDDFKVTVDATTPAAPAKKQPEKSQFEKDFGLKHEKGGFVAAESSGTSSGAAAVAQQQETK